MGKKLHVINAVIVFIMLAISGILLLMNIPSSLDIAMVLAANIYLWSLFGLFIIWFVFMILSFFRTNTDNGNYKGSAVTNIVTAIVGLLVFCMIFVAKLLSDAGKINLTASGTSTDWMLAFMLEGSFALILILAPIVFLISFILFLVGYFREV